MKSMGGRVGENTTGDSDLGSAIRPKFNTVEDDDLAKLDGDQSSSLFLNKEVFASGTTILTTDQQQSYQNHHLNMQNSFIVDIINNQ